MASDQIFRKEIDSMGEVEIPLEALYGPQTQRALNNFTIPSPPLPWAFIAAILEIKEAAAVANRRLGLLSAQQASAIEAAVATLLAQQSQQHFPLTAYQTGSATSTNMNVNEVIVGLARLSGLVLSANDHVNLGQSSNDVIPSAIHLAACQAVSKQLLPALTSLAVTIREFAARHRQVIKTARTHLMDALPIYLQAEMEAWAAQLDEAVERLEGCLPRLARLPLGGTAVGSGVNCHPDFAAQAIARLRETTGITFTPAPSLYKNISSLDSVVELSGHLRAGAVALNKIAEDLRWMNSGPLTGLGEIRLPALQPGSSIMPAKVNPVICEAVRMACAQIIGNDATLTLAGLGGNFQLNTMLPLAAARILESVELLAASAQTLGKNAIEGMVVNQQAYRQTLAHNPILVTALNPRIGYLRAAEIAKKAQAEGRTILEVASELTDIEPGELQRLLDPARLADGG
jgi:fumarate hydratase, class II